jgi:hypothetical protein
MTEQNNIVNEQSTGDLNIDYSDWRKEPLPEGTEWASMAKKFDDKRKAKYLEFMEMYGKKVLAAKLTGVAYSTVYYHMEHDPEFAETVETALDNRAERIVHMLEEQAINGYKQPIFSKSGEYLGEKTLYESNLRLAMLKRYDPAYKDGKGDGVVINNNTGAVVVPAGVPAEDWEKLYSDKAQGLYRPERAVKAES